MWRRVQGHCAKIYDDPEEDNGTQERRIGMFREERKRQKEEEEEGKGREDVITVDLVLRARGNMQPPRRLDRRASWGRRC